MKTVLTNTLLLKTGATRSAFAALALLACAGVTGATGGAIGTAAGAPEVTAPAAPAEPAAPAASKWFAGVGVGGELATWSGDDTKGGFLPGAFITGGLRFSSFTQNAFWRNVTLSGDIGFFTGSWSETVTLSADYADPLAIGTPYTDRARAKRKSEQLSIPVLATLAYNFSVGKNADGAPRFGVRVGPSLGVTYVSMKSKFGDGEYIGTFNAAGQWVAPVENGEPLPGDSKSGGKALLTYGATLAGSWNITRRVTLDLAYRFHATTGLDLGASRDYGSSMNHQITLGANWRF
jgi:hypothetical protein